MLFPVSEIPTFELKKEKDFRSLKYPVWSEQKAHLIQDYLRLFTYITKHGVYIDGFAAPQQRGSSEICSAKLVLENEPKRIRDFWLCDIDLQGISILKEVVSSHFHKGRRINLLHGDFNLLVDEILLSDKITVKTASFALLDQRTFECEWETVKKIAAHKMKLGPAKTKIEIFYFLATGWLDRSIAAVKLPETAGKLERWWGRPDWRLLQGMQSIPRANLMAERFKAELGYASARTYAIHSQKRKGRIMYHMIHATDHEETPTLMLRAYRKISGRSDVDITMGQIDMEELWREAEGI